MQTFGTIIGSLGPPSTLTGSLVSSGTAPCEPYEGPYEYTPTEQTQTISIEELRATQDIVINPIPSNYGLITWDGVTLTVS